MKKDFYKHIIFDWNGTLLNDTPLHYELCQKAFSEYNDFIFTEYRGLTVEQISALRKKLREHEAPLKVVKNN